MHLYPVRAHHAAYPRGPGFHAPREAAPYIQVAGRRRPGPALPRRGKTGRRSAALRGRAAWRPGGPPGYAYTAPPHRTPVAAQCRMVQHEPALVLSSGGRRHLVIADLHVGLEDSLGAGVSVGKMTSTGDLVEDLGRAVGKSGADSLVVLGDAKSGTGSIVGGEWSGVREFFEAAHGMVEDVALVPGNHDAGIERLLPGRTELASPAGLVVGNVLLTHGHAMPSDNLSHVDGIVMGHVHPVFRGGGSVLDGRPVWLSIRADGGLLFPSRAGRAVEITVVPAFNRYARAGREGGRGIRARGGGRGGPTSPIIERIKRGRGWEARIITLDGSIIGGGPSSLEGAA